VKKKYEGEVDICSRDRAVRERGEAHYGSSYGEKTYVENERQISTTYSN